MRNDDAQIAVIFMFFLAIAAIGFYWVVVAGITDTVTDVHNNITQSGSVPLSQDRQDSLALMQGAIRILPVLAFVLTIISAIVLSMANRYSTV